MQKSNKVAMFCKYGSNGRNEKVLTTAYMLLSLRRGHHIIQVFIFWVIMITAETETRTHRYREIRHPLIDFF